MTGWTTKQKEYIRKYCTWLQCAHVSTNLFNDFSRTCWVNTVRCSKQAVQASMTWKKIISISGQLNCMTTHKIHITLSQMHLKPRILLKKWFDFGKFEGEQGSWKESFVYLCICSRDAEHHEIALKERIAHEITFFRGTFSFSGVISWIAIRTSAGVNAGPVWADPCRKHS
jgi:hypothetical protein